MESTQLYRKGENPQLDNEFARNRRLRLYRGNVMFEVLTDKRGQNSRKVVVQRKTSILKTNLGGCLEAS